MRAATTVEAAPAGTWRRTVEYVVEAERLGLDMCWVAEAWGSDAVSALGFLAARTTRLRLGSGVVQVGTRSATAVAQLAITLAELTEGRFLLGLGASGPQVIEGLHGTPFTAPLARLRETVDVVRQAVAGDKIALAGRHVHIPLAGSDARPMRLSLTTTYPVPIYVAAMSPRTLEYTGREADGWLGTSFVPEGAAAYVEPLERGLAAAGRTRADLDLCQGAEIAVFDDEDAVRAHVATRKRELAFSLGGMGSATTNFYRDAYGRQGWGELADAVRERWQAGDHDGAAASIPDGAVLATTLIGTEARVRHRLREWHAVGIDTVRLYPAGDTLDARLANLARGIELVHATSSR